MWYEVVVTSTYFGHILQVLCKLHHLIVYSCLQALKYYRTLFWRNDVTRILDLNINNERGWYLWRIPCFFTHQNLQICLLFFAGQARHTGVGQSGFWIRSIHLTFNVLKLSFWFFSTAAFLCIFSSTVCTWIITITGVPMGLSLADATVVFKLCRFFCGGRAGCFCSPNITLLSYVSILYRT